ncbi:hypothetical protein ACFPVX_22195 [Cohnella faecalis]|uniref:Uncharacterized protein n=1 Tax=Cohnella faecalis TaxID=2315694 RepID=A0A398CHI6_9BACL|nr:hypothetical protein [Cohnella faecalis]RIE00388.1 hypothetical protein D3H35_28645 [Cohnella faecalis]
MAQPSTRRLRAFAAAAFLSLVVSLLPLSAVHAGSDGHAGKLDAQVKQWVAELSRQSAFAAWEKAVPEIQPIGPGTHGWLVTLSANGKPVGYLVVNAAEDGTFQLGEYGAGPDVLFSESLLRQALKENGLLLEDAGRAVPVTVARHYAHPLAAVWEVTAGEDTYWLDAKTGELIPIDGKAWNSKFGTATYKPPTVSNAVKVASLTIRETFDPYERLPWLLGDKPFSVRESEKVQNRIRSNLHLRYVSEPFGDAMLYALPVVGFQRWTSGRLDLALDMQGTRFIPMDTLSRFGLFYR